MDRGLQLPFFSDPTPDAGASEAIAAGFSLFGRLSPVFASYESAFADQNGPAPRALFLDAAASLLAEADRSWASGRVFEALALEGLEARLLEQLVTPGLTEVGR